MMSVLFRHWFSKAAALGISTLAMSAMASGEVEAQHEEAPIVGNSVRAQEAVGALSPDVRAFIEDTYLFHAAEVPDANEPVAALSLYLQGSELLDNGDVEGAVEIFSRAVAAFPDTRHAHAGLGRALLARYDHHERSQADLRRAVTHFVRAADIAMDHGKVRYTDVLARILGETKDAAQLQRLFRRAMDTVELPVVGNHPYAVTLDYAQGLARLGRPEAERQFKKALTLAPAGNFDGLVGYAEWLLDNARPAEVLTLIDAQHDAQYTHFLRGVALDRLGQGKAALAEYQRFSQFSKTFPAPSRFRVPGSLGQQEVSFEEDLHAQTHCAGHTRLSTMLYCEARGESEGGQRLVGWTARKRVFRGTISGCISISNGGATLCDQYYNVIGQSGQFYIGCGTRSATSDHVAHDVFNGLANDPLSGYCPGTSTTSTTCDGAYHCPGGTSGAGVHSPVWFDLGCTASTTCKHNHGTLCGNDNVGNDHCFYNNH
jgi:tetratricopeptide (TPR) repeat protein